MEMSTVDTCKDIVSNDVRLYLVELLPTCLHPETAFFFLERHTFADHRFKTQYHKELDQCFSAYQTPLLPLRPRLSQALLFLIAMDGTKNYIANAFADHLIREMTTAVYLVPVTKVD